jgi:copper chaperone
MSRIAYEVPGMSCGHCVAAVSDELSQVPGVEGVEVDLASKQVVVRGEALDDAALRAAIERAGYQAG